MHRPALAPEYHRMAVGSRLLAMAILGIPTLVFGERSTLVGLGVLGLTWLLATAAERVRWVGPVALVVEAAVVGLVAALSLEGSSTLIAALALPPFTAGLRKGVRGVAAALSVELVVLVAVTSSSYGALEAEQASSVLTSVLTGIGLGLIASYVHAQLNRPPDPLTPYRDAQRLLRDLIDLSGNLGSGLDAATHGSRIAVMVRDELPLLAVSVHVPRQDELTPLVTGAMSTTVDEDSMSGVATAAQEKRTPQIAGQAFAIPLVTEVGVVGVVAGILPPRLDPRRLLASGRFDAVGAALDAAAVHLDTALLFSKLRDAATADERRRLAREMHDGVAQDIASLGYLVDALAASPSTPAQAEMLQRLRDRITTVVTEVRLSVQTLRTDAEASESLGAAISGLARHLSESSGIPIRVAVDERTTRLRSEIESELLRIAQEAMTNAVRHSGATSIEVDCRVAAPTAEIVVRDDGHGLGRARPDSFGLDIMRERAALIDADLSIASDQPRGTVVKVRVPSRHARTSPTRDGDSDRVSV
ncbi:sensor histidine kinase [Nocardioides euryhalodurans]|uniref:Sensor histidine kinase n=1 Tax=Nocardioides euryhalodurans TaxID=2518370 RepID=A0A4P7GPM0_9ACTN|nr:sensor histidine kinase [Nocardioides euryhalodurans]QBR94198.1 sensor histidine kinase [Nocardioides euryhalodurans]